MLMLEMQKKRDSKYYSKIGRDGGLARIRLHGNPGTTEGRSMGGKTAVHNMRKNDKGVNNGFVLAKEVSAIRKNVFTAEFLGVLFGDGYVSRYQTGITLDSKTDREYAEYLKSAIEKNFDISVTMRFRKNARALDLIISSVSFCGQMIRLGMPLGSKLANGIRIPSWILRSEPYLKAFIRGLFDTDGTIYLERKSIKGKEYRYLGMAITSASPNFLYDIASALKSLGLSPTNTVRQKSVFLRRQKDVDNYFLEVSSNNSKHSVRYQKFKLERCESG